MSDQNDMNVDNGLDDFDDGGFEEFGKKGTIADLWRNNPFVKIGIILAAFIFVVAGIILFGGKPEAPIQSRVSNTADVNEAPGTSEVSQAYSQALQEVNQTRTEEAIRQDSSVLPIPVSPPVGIIPQQLNEEEAEDPLDRWRRLQEERAAQQQLVVPEADDIQALPDTRGPAVQALSQAMSQQMESVLGAQDISGLKTKNISNLRYLEALEAKRQQQLQVAAQAQLAATGNVQDIGKILVPAATIEYAQLITEANTDAPGPVLAQIQSGPLKGARVLGRFSSTEEFLTLNFNQVVLDGVSQPTNAVALDPGTTLPGVVTDIDRRYFKRIILPAAAAFVEGLAEAIANSDKTTVTIIGADSATQTTTTGDAGGDESVASGIEEAGSKISTLMDQEASRTRPMLKIRAGTPIGILFLRPVLEKPLPLQASDYEESGIFGTPQTQPFFGQGVNPYAQQQPSPYYPQPYTYGSYGAGNSFSGNAGNNGLFGNAGYFNNIIGQEDADTGSQ